MTEEGAALKIIRDLKAAIYAVLQGYRGGQQAVTDASAELHRLCGCLEWLLQFDQKEQKRFLKPRKDYWDFLCTALGRQRGDTESTRFVHSQDKLKTPLGRGRAFIRFCLAHGQLAESLQLCLLDPGFTREWYGPRSPLVCPELQEDLLDCLYALNEVSFDLELQRPDLDGAWPMFSESSCCNSRLTKGRRPRKIKDSPKQILTTHEGPKGVQSQATHANQVDCLQEAPREDRWTGLPRPQQLKRLPSFLEKKREDPRSLISPQDRWEPKWKELQQDQEKEDPKTGIFLENSISNIQGQEQRVRGALKGILGTEAEARGVLPRAEGQRTAENTREREADWGRVQRLLTPSPIGTMEDTVWRSRQEQKASSISGEHQVLQDPQTKESSTTEKPQEQTGVTSVTRKAEQEEVNLQAVVKSLRLGLQKTCEQTQHQEQLLKKQEGLLKALQEQLSRCQEERAQLQAELEQKQQEAEQRDAMYAEELGGQRDLVHALKRRVLELIQEKDHLWQKVQQLSSLAPGCCVCCSKIFGRLSRRYPCRLCGGLVCHACAGDFKKREHYCPACTQKREAQDI
ncbi:RUN and FYVE domain-containing protein 4 [Talpa occidentalis]|uniref:RUN and FYVE domain-containing protein 4 n=1 Tax=Talpa occidentalis TaxID=50954 RepID=UPI0018906C1B|nr:RUN and FYVE domain-containing protein 4 [Talpa occidentalis]